MLGGGQGKELPFQVAGKSSFGAFHAHGARQQCPQGHPSSLSHISAGLQRQVLFGGLRIGMYDPVKSLFVGKDHVGEVGLLTKIAAGMTTGALGIAVANPTDLVKVRSLSRRRLGLVAWTAGKVCCMMKLWT